MVLNYPMNPFYQLSVDTSGPLPHKYFEEDDSTLDDAALDHSALDSGLEMSPPMAVSSRRDSFTANNGVVFSPKQEEWPPVELQSLPSAHPFAEYHSTNPFLRMGPQPLQHHQHAQDPHQHQHQHQPLGAPLGSWAMTATTSAASIGSTPVAHYDGLPPDYSASASIFQRGPLQPPYTALGSLFSSVPSMPRVSAAGHGPAPASAASVPMQLSSSDASISTQPTSKAASPQSPMIRSHNEMHRGDGIRKKNTRFDIPAERNLNNIDHLIAQSTDELEIKELKQQKRLLRNRQAALDSRQRKKQHTERLEDEKKHFTAMLADMEQGMEGLKLQVSELLQEKQNYSQYIESLDMEKEEMIRQHTLETAELRKKISVLTSHVQALEGASAASSMPNHPSAYAGTGAGAGAAGAGGGQGIAAFGDMESLAMNGAHGSWGHVFPGMVGADQEQHEADVKQEMQLLPVTHKPSGNEANESALVSAEKPNSQGGLLFMLFLVGAFVLSSRQTPSIPRVSEDVRVASAALLENVLKDAGVAQDTPGLDVASAAAAAAAAASSSTGANTAAVSGTPWAQTAGQSLGGEPSVLGQLSDQLMQPTEQQANEQLFSLSASQYSGVVNYQPSASERAGAAFSPGASRGRRNLAEALAATRGNSKADVYTRSLLWDQIPSEVVRTFAKMVSEVNTASPTADGKH